MGERARSELGQSVSATTSQRLKVSREGLLLIKSFEGFRPRTVRRRDGVPVIGYGHVKSARPGATITEAEAELLLQYDLLPIVEAINSRVSIPLNQHQFDALASFIFSVGVQRFEGSDVLERLNAGSTAQAAEALSQSRQRYAEELGAKVSASMHELAMPDGRFAIEVRPDAQSSISVSSVSPFFSWIISVPSSRFSTRVMPKLKRMSMPFSRPAATNRSTISLSYPRSIRSPRVASTTSTPNS